MARPESPPSCQGVARRAFLVGATLDLPSVAHPCSAVLPVVLPKVFPVVHLDGLLAARLDDHQGARNP